jgi:hypothetical protein
MRRRLALALLPLTWVAAACDAIPLFDRPKKKKKRKVEEDEDEVSNATTTATEASAPPASTPKKPVVVYDSPERPTRNEAGIMDKPEGLVRAIKDELGESPRVLGITIFYDYAVVDTRDPAKPKRKRKFIHRGGVLREWEQKVNIDSDAEQLAREEFALAEVAWKDLPKTTKDAVSRFGSDYGELTHLNIGRAVMNKGIELHYHLKNDSRSGMVSYTAQGKFIELQKH